MITSPTRVTNRSSSIIEHVYTPYKEHIVEYFVPENALSDHFLACYKLLSKEQQFVS